VASPNNERSDGKRAAEVVGRPSSSTSLMPQMPTSCYSGACMKGTVVDNVSGLRRVSGFRNIK
jgi:hypothetical protein